MARKRKEEGPEKVKTVHDTPKRGRPRKEDAPPIEVSKDDMALLARDTGRMTLAEYGCRSDDPDYRDLLLIRLVEQGISPSVAATLAGYQSRTQGSRVLRKARVNPRFKQKIEALHERMRQSYIASKVATLPVLSAIESAALEEYKADPRLAIDKPKLLRDLRIVSGVQTTENAVQNNLTINIEALQRVVQGDFEVVTVEPGEAGE